MSDTTTPPPAPPTLPPIIMPAVSTTLTDLMIWGTISVSVLIAGGFVTALVLAFVKGDQTNLNLLIGAVIAQFSSVVTYWLGGTATSTSATRALTAHALRLPPSS